MPEHENAGTAASEHLRIARVLHEDDDFLTLEVPKSMHREIRLEEGDAFLSFLFVHQVEHEDGSRSMESWLPWEGQQ